MTKETCDALEEVLVDYIQALGDVPPDSDAAKVITEQVEKMFKMLTEEEKVENKRVFDEAAQELEREKNGLKADKVIFELVKVFGPVLLTIVAYSILQKRLLKFEETGGLSTFAGKSFHLPKFW